MKSLCFTTETVCKQGKTEEGDSVATWGRIMDPSSVSISVETLLSKYTCKAQTHTHTHTHTEQSHIQIYVK